MLWQPDKPITNFSLEFNWLASNNPIFTGVLYRHYNAPPGFCFDRRCTDPPMVANQESPEFNMGRVNDFVKYMDEQVSIITTQIC